MSGTGMLSYYEKHLWTYKTVIKEFMTGQLGWGYNWLLTVVIPYNIVEAP
jgi:hypothetical protein